MNIQQISEFLDQTKVFYLFTVDENKPKTRPIGFHLLLDDKLYFGVGEHKAVYKQVMANPNIEIVAVKDAKWIRYYGEIVISQDSELVDYVLDCNPNLKNIYSDETGHKLAIFHLKNANVEVMAMGTLIDSAEL